MNKPSTESSSPTEPLKPPDTRQAQPNFNELYERELLRLQEKPPSKELLENLIAVLKPKLNSEKQQELENWAQRRLARG